MKPFKNALLTSIWYNFISWCDAYARRIRMASSLATGAKVSPKSNHSTWENPFATSLALFLTTMPWSSCLLWNTHFVPMTLVSCGHSSSVQTSFRVKLFNSSCMAFIQLESWKSFFYILRFNTRDKRVMFNKRSKLLRSSHYTLWWTPYDKILWMSL